MDQWRTGEGNAGNAENTEIAQKTQKNSQMSFDDHAH
jgi:hypothetical protein